MNIYVFIYCSTPCNFHFVSFNAINKSKNMPKNYNTKYMGQKEINEIKFIVQFYDIP